MSIVPMYTTHCRPSSAATVADATAMLAGAGLGHDALLAHALHQQGLAQEHC